MSPILLARLSAARAESLRLHTVTRHMVPTDNARWPRDYFDALKLVQLQLVRKGF